MKKFGIDISVYQKDMNLSQAKNEGVEFTIIRGAYGDKKDTAFENNYNKAKSLGLGVGVYWWTRAVNGAQAREEAQVLVNTCLKGKQFEYPIYIDVEDSLLKNIGKLKVDEVITEACKTLESNGYYAGFYMNEDWYKNRCNGSSLAKRFTCWIAKWCKSEQTAYPMWQFGGETNYIRGNKVAGVTCDQDYCFVDFPSAIKSAGLNGFSKGANPTPQPKQTSSNGFLGSKGYFKYGDTHANIGKIAKFMRNTFPAYTNAKALGNTLGPNLTSSIKEFQKRCKQSGLYNDEIDGMIGEKTLACLKHYGFRY